MTEIKWTEPACKDLEEIYDYLAIKNKRNAGKLYNTILDASEVLENSPLAGKLESQLPDHRTLILKKHYKLVYCMVEQTVYIVAIWDCRQTPSSLSRKLTQLKR